VVTHSQSLVGAEVRENAKITPLCHEYVPRDMTAGGDELPKVLAAGETVTAGALQVRDRRRSPRRGGYRAVSPWIA
jgi:hypothetical protein